MRCVHVTGSTADAVHHRRRSPLRLHVDTGRAQAGTRTRHSPAAAESLLLGRLHLRSEESREFPTARAALRAPAVEHHQQSVCPVDHILPVSFHRLPVGDLEHCLPLDPRK